MASLLRRLALSMLLVAPALSAQDGMGFVETKAEVADTVGVTVDQNIISGSAPLNITFSATLPDDAVYELWELAEDPDFQNIMLRYNESTFSRVFNDYGTFYVRFYCADADGQREWMGITYVIQVFESKLLCPNAFTPYGSPGINDEWKVVATSITDFDCVIVNRYGNEIAHLTSVDQSWDGRYKGKLVPQGVYFYIIRARGADGREYKLAGDINLIGSNVYTPDNSNNNY